MKKPILILFALMVLNTAFAEMIMPTKITLNVTKNSAIYIHQMQKSQTIYALAKFFQISSQDIKAHNPKIDFNNIKVNQKVRIPLNKELIVSKKSQLSNSHAYVPVFYKVKPKETLYRISKVYFGQSVENIKSINKLGANNIKIGQEILVGWYSYNSSYRERVLPNSTPIVKAKPATETEGTKVVSHKKNDKKVEEVQIFETKTKKFSIASDNYQFSTTSEASDGNDELSKDPFERMNKMKAGAYHNKPATYERKVTAIWNKDTKDQNNLYVLHSTAKINSYIEIFNPMLNRVVIAKVVGNIPAKTYKKDVELIVSPKVAKTLGAIDKKFFVRIKYIK